MAVHTLPSNSACRIIGFEELGNVDGFSTATLELRLLHTGSVFFVIKRRDSNISSNKV